MFKQRESREINWNFNKFRWERNEAKNKQQGINEKSMQETFPRIERKKTVRARFSFVRRERERETFFDLSALHSSSSLPGVYLYTTGEASSFIASCAQLTLDQPRRNFVSCCANCNSTIELSINWVGKILKRARILEFREKLVYFLLFLG